MKEFHIKMKIILATMSSLVMAAPLSAMSKEPAPVGVPAQQPVTAQPAAAGQLSSDQFIQSAVAVGEMLYAGRIAEVYDGASPVMKHVVTRDAFISNTTARLSKVGKITDHQWLQVGRVHFQSTQPAAAGTTATPDGTYISIELLARTDAGKVVPEQISFRFDEDGVWRLSGFAIREAQ